MAGAWLIYGLGGWCVVNSWAWWLVCGKFGGLGGWRGVSRISVAHASTIPKEKLERQEIVEYAMRLTLAIPGVRPPGW